ncbi:pyridoxamine 5'-phosphate oxidase family protein [Halobacillus litoralis]|uniref:pyridoxamine 5'-phosphate oxidase family protein n=1 Tax=Halobacillus litoralis TaxID=45668 RepID=UPI001CFDC995|nr:pyridoxamine 5'-phosphate oxidase family protein [Halobacillus litoralis]
MNVRNIVKDEEELRKIIGHPSELVNNKVINDLDQNCVTFIQQSPFLTLATSDQNGCTDVSPRGDYPGFVHVLDQNHIIIPERPGNKRLDSLTNILTNSGVGIIFFIPGMGETLRINGNASIVTDEELLEPMSFRGNMPLVGIVVEVKECFIHCAKALKRSKLWEPSSWKRKEELPSAAKMIAEHAGLPNLNEEQVEKRLQKSYKDRLY